MTETLIRSRAQIKSAVTRFRSYVQKTAAEGGDCNNLEHRITNYKPLLSQFNDIQSQIELQDNSCEDNEREEFENNYYELLVLSERLLKSLKSSDQDNQPGPSGNNNTGGISIQLPVINLPKFSGLYTEWTAFHDSFNSIINDNRNLSDIQKLHYLKGCVVGDAKRTIETLPIASNSYGAAWKLLTERYQNKRLIVQHHLQVLFTLTPLNKSLTSLRELIDKFQSHLAALKAQGIDTDQWDVILVHLLTTKFDFQTKKDWESQLKGTELATLQQCLTFLENRCFSLESMEFSQKSLQKPFNSNTRYNQNVIAHTSDSCILCSKNHNIFHCDEFLKLKVSDRVNKVKHLKLCFNCLKSGHNTKECRSTSCKTCGNKHNTLLHFENPKKSNTHQIQNSSINQCEQGSHIEIMLSTAVINCRNNTGSFLPVRALLDQGSQQHLVTESLCNKLQLNTKLISASISGVCNNLVKIKKSCEIEFKSSTNNYIQKVQCLVVPNINNNFPIETFDKELIPIPKNIQLADENYNISAPIDMLIGASLFWELLDDGLIKLHNQLTYLQNTRLGWILGGPYTIAAINIKKTVNMCCHISRTKLDEQLYKEVNKFWEIENFDINKTVLTEEEKLCEQIFQQQHKRDSNGKFIVRLPFKNNNLQIGSTKQIALKRFSSLEKKFSCDKQFKLEYCNFMNDYIELGHMQVVEDFVEGCILPHHGVIKESSTTTKLRAVFDASCKSSNGTSLNDHLMVGPNLQKNIFSLLIKCRQYQYVLSADIIKMYRQIWVSPNDWKFQQILWRDNPSNKLQLYNLKTVTYGTACAPYLAMKCLKQLALESSREHPNASKVINEDFYMDDLLTGTNTIEEAVILRDNLISILKGGGFELSKWASNRAEILPHSGTNSSIVRLDSNAQTKTLGLSWDCTNDNLKYEIKNIKYSRLTKRTVLSIIATIYDPIGLLSPILVTAKLILQKLWQSQCDWDDTLPSELHSKFSDFISQLNQINKLSIPRKVIPLYPYRSIELHGFSDASTQAYGASIYIRTTDYSDNHTVNLLCAKAKVAPIKQISLPRLELCAAVLAAKLFSNIEKALKIKFDNYYLWTDSTIVLSWIAAPPNRWQTFVANRVSEIQSLTENTQWRHIDGNQNPADIISRGIDPKELRNNKKWFHGPTFLLENHNNWPEQKFCCNKDIPEQRNSYVVSHYIKIEFPLFEKISSYMKLKRIVAYCFRFIYNCRNNANKTSDILTVEELKIAEISILKIIQNQHFNHELRHLATNHEVDSNSPLKTLNPFLDKSGLIRVGGRLQNSELSFDSKHQILLPKNHLVTKLIIRYFHERELHAGAQATLAAIRQIFWPISGRSVVRQVLYKCVKCFRTIPVRTQELMGNLPSSRVVPTRPFTNCGVDYAGPIMIRESRGRGKRLIKSYTAIFICLVTKAIHLELVLDYTSESFLNALKRLIARRGKVKCLYSDNGTNFVGANKELKSFLQSKNFKSVVETLTNEGICWKFIPPKSPYMGGIWEAGVKSFKKHFKRVVGSSLITIEEMHTLLCLIEACLNSRPLTPLSNDPNDLSPLTPGHFLIGTPLTASLEYDLKETKDNRLSRWQQIEKLRQLFWQRWQKEYLVELQRRNKWNQRSPTPIKVGTMVTIVEDNLPPLLWKMGRVVELHPGADDVVRVVTIKTDKGLTKRGVNRLCVLPIEQDDCV